MTSFSKLAAASAVALTLAGTGMPASAAVLGGAGEALLVPLAVWNGGRFSDDNCYDGDINTFCDLTKGYTPAMDTVFEIWVPSQIGQDAIPNIYTAVHTTPSPAGGQNVPAGAAVRWYWYDERGNLLKNGQIPVVPDQVVQVSLTAAAAGLGESTPGYMVFTTDRGNNQGSTGASFAFFANAWLTGAFSIDRPDDRPFPGVGFPLIGGSIPVLAMNDGPDAATNANCPPPSADDRVTYDNQAPCLVSPTASGFRPGNGDGLASDFVFDLALSDRYANTMHVIWFDQNPDRKQKDGSDWPDGNVARTFDGTYPNNQLNSTSDQATVRVYNTQGQLTGGTSVRLPNRLNVLWIPPAWDENPNTLFFINEPFAWTTQTLSLPFVIDPVTELPLPAFASYSVNEYIDSGDGTAETAGIAFAIKYSALLVQNDVAEPDVDAVVALIETSLGHDRGNF